MACYCIANRAGGVCGKSTLLRVARFVVRAETVPLGPAGSRIDVALGQQQPRPLRWHRIRKACSGRAWRHPFGLPDRVERPGGITGGLPDPRQGRQPSGERRGVVDRPEPRDPLGHMPQGGLELAPLVFHLRHACVRDARSRQGPLAGRRGDLQRQLVGSEDCVEAALRELDVAEKIADRCGNAALTGHPPARDARREAALSIIQSAAEPIGQSQFQLAERRSAAFRRRLAGCGPAMPTWPQRQHRRASTQASPSRQRSPPGGSSAGSLPAPPRARRSPPQHQQTLVLRRLSRWQPLQCGR